MEQATLIGIPFVTRFGRTYKKTNHESSTACDTCHPYPTTSSITTAKELSRDCQLTVIDRRLRTSQNQASVMALFVFLVGVVVGLLLLAGHLSDAFSNRPTSSFARSTRLASSTNYLQSLSVPKPLGELPLSALPELPAEETVTLSSDGVVEEVQDETTSDTAFPYVPILTLRHADAIADKVIECCTRNGFNPITVFVLDAFSGSPLVSKRMDGCSPIGVPDFAKAKAYSCLVNKYPSRTFRDRYTSTDSSAKFCQMTTMVAVAGNSMAPFPGGILLKVGDSIVGAVGVSGAAGDEDEYCAIRGVVEVGLGISTVPEKPTCDTMKDDL